jgi:hypothetical protein
LPEIVGFKLKGMVMKIRVLALTVALMLPVSSQAAEPFTFAVSVNSKSVCQRRLFIGGKPDPGG